MTTASGVSSALRRRLPASWAGVAAAAVLCIVGAVVPTLALAQPSPMLTPFSSASGADAPSPWRFSSLPNKTPTRFEVVQLAGQRVLKVQADESYGNLVHPVQAPLNASTTLAWRWRVDEFVAGADLRTRAGDDGAAKVCVFFDLPTDRLSLGERTRLALARRATGEDVPSEALCYVWDNKEPKGSQLVNAFTKRMRMVVLESGQGATAGSWTSERRNLLADYQRAFGDESGGTLPDVVAVAISADADNTHGHGLSYFSDIDLRSVAAPAGNAATLPVSSTPQGQ
jgi:hypothetical protein